MSDAVRMEVAGDQEVARALDGIAADLDDVNDGLVPELVAATRRTAPVLSGTLRANVRGERSKGRAAAVVAVPYGGVINYGWPRHNVAAQNFIAAASASLDGDAPRQVDRAIDSSISRRGLSQ